MDGRKKNTHFSVDLVEVPNEAYYSVLKHLNWIHSTILCILNLLFVSVCVFACACFISSMDLNTNGQEACRLGMVKGEPARGRERQPAVILEGLK